MQTISVWVKQHPVLAYFVLTYVISWGSILLVIGPSGIVGAPGPSQATMPLVYVAMLLGPSVAGLLLISVVNGKPGFRDLLTRWRKWRVGTQWYAVALLTAPLLVLVIDLALSSSSAAYLPGILASDNQPSILLMGLIAGLLVGFFEELGWTGFVIPELRRRHGILATGLIVGLLWGLWHLPLFSGAARSSGDVAPATYLFVQLFAFLPAFRVLMVWLYDRTGSLPLAMLMHAGSTGGTLILGPLVVGAQSVIFNLIYGACLWLFVAVVAVANRGQLATRAKMQAPAS